MSAGSILIVDDDPRNIFALKATLEARGLAVLTAKSATEGLAILNSDQKLSIVLLDMMMPGMDGYEALNGIRNSETRHSIPVIAVTAQAMKGDREKCLKAGANDYIAKPIDVDVLFSKIESYLH